MRQSFGRLRCHLLNAVPKHAIFTALIKICSSIIILFFVYLIENFALILQMLVKNME